MKQRREKQRKSTKLEYDSLKRATKLTNSELE